MLELLRVNAHKRLYFSMYTPLSCASMEEETSLQHEEITPNKGGSQVISMATKRVSRDFTAGCLVSFHPSSAEPLPEECSRGSAGVEEQPVNTSQTDHSLTTRQLCPCFFTFPFRKERMKMSNLQLYTNITNKIIWPWLKLQPWAVISSSICGGMLGESRSLTSSQAVFSALPAHPFGGSRGLRIHSTSSQGGSWRFLEPSICF